MDLRKLEQLIEDSGKGTLLFNRIDLAADWMDFCIRKIEQGIKIISTVSLDTLYDLSKSPDSGQQNLTQRFFIPMRLYPLSYREYLRYTHKSGGEQVVNEYMLRGSFPACCVRRTPRPCADSTPKSSVGTPDRRRNPPDPQHPCNGSCCT